MTDGEMQRLTYRRLATRLELEAQGKDRDGISMARVGVPGTRCYADADVLRECAGLVRSLCRSARARRRLVQVCEFRAQVSADERPVWSRCGRAIEYHLLSGDGPDPLAELSRGRTKRPGGP